MTNANANVASLIRELRGAFDRSAAVPVHDILDEWPTQPPQFFATEAPALPVTHWVPEAQKHAPQEMRRLLASLCEYHGDLSWQQTYSEADMDRFFLDRYGWTLLVGPGAPLQSDRLLAGLLLLGADVEYPPHQHAAEEVYVVLSGTASWKLDDAAWQPMAPGSVVHNPPWRTHGMRTDHDQPLLLGFLWKAGQPEKSRILG